MIAETDFRSYVKKKLRIVLKNNCNSHFIVLFKVPNC